MLQSRGLSVLRSSAKRRQIRLGTLGRGKATSILRSQGTLTLALFLALSGAEVAYFEKKPKLTKLLAILACALTIVTALSSIIIAGLHSFA